jgi:hypothetical protein
MTRKHFLLAVPVIGFVIGIAYVGRAEETAATKMTAAAEKFLAGLNDEQKKEAMLAFDDADRINFHFVPRQDKDKKPLRKGLRLEKMTAEQKDAARALLRTGTSESGYKSALAIMSLESILKDQEKGGTNVRNPEWYFFTVFGKPGKSGKWGWRVEGHHLSLNFTLEDGKIVSATPAIFGANPAIVTDGDRKGLKAIPESEESALQLFQALDAKQREVALQKDQFKEIPQAEAKPTYGDPVGLPASKMNARQRAILTNLLQGYANRLSPEIAAAEMAKINDAGFDKVHFAFATDPGKPGDPYTYRVQGPTFVIEFLNVQDDSGKNPANHIHSGLRNMKGDFGLTN